MMVDDWEKWQVTYQPAPGMNLVVKEWTLDELLAPNGEDPLIVWLMREANERGLFFRVDFGRAHWDPPDWTLTIPRAEEPNLQPLQDLRIHGELCPKYEHQHGPECVDCPTCVSIKAVEGLYEKPEPPPFPDSIELP